MMSLPPACSSITDRWSPKDHCEVSFETATRIAHRPADLERRIGPHSPAVTARSHRCDRRRIRNLPQPVKERTVHRPLNRGGALHVSSSRTRPTGTAAAPQRIDLRNSHGARGGGRAPIPSPVQDDCAADPQICVGAPVAANHRRPIHPSPHPRARAHRSPTDAADNASRHPEGRCDPAYRRSQRSRVRAQSAFSTPTGASAEQIAHPLPQRRDPCRRHAIHPFIERVPRPAAEHDLRPSCHSIIRK